MLIKRTLVAGVAYAAGSIEHPSRGHLAVAVKTNDGWQVAKSAGGHLTDKKTVPDQRRAVALMLRTAAEVARVTPCDYPAKVSTEVG